MRAGRSAIGNLAAEHAEFLEIHSSLPVLRAPRLMSEPARNRDLLVGVELERIAAVCLQIPEETVFRAAEGEICHRGGDADVHANHRRGGLLAELAGGAAAAGEDRR